MHDDGIWGQAEKKETIFIFNHFDVKFKQMENCWYYRYLKNIKNYK